VGEEEGEFWGSLIRRDKQLKGTLERKGDIKKKQKSIGEEELGEEIFRAKYGLTLV